MESLFRSYPKLDIRPPKKIWIFFGIGILVPGFGELYLGDAHRAQGLLKLVTVLLCFPLIFAWGLGLFLLAYLWIANLFTISVTSLRALFQKE